MFSILGNHFLAQHQTLSDSSNSFDIEGKERLDLVFRYLLKYKDIEKF
jgi:hypothetical protein